MGTATIFRARPPVAKLRAFPSRGIVGAALLLLVAFCLLAAGAVSNAPAGDGDGPQAGAFILDPAVAVAGG